MNEATNEMGLSIAALNFPQLAHYQSKVAGKENLAPYELILYILGQCKDLQEAMALLPKIHLWALPFSRQYPLTPLHWLLADETGCMVLEPTKDGLKQYPNPAHVLTNAPGFPWHQYNLANYMQLHNTPAENNIGIQSLQPYSNGMGAIGLPGDLSSASRFVRASFHVVHATKDAGICDFFHILHSVAMPRGSVYVHGNLPEITRYSCCCDVKQGIYYYTTYTNSRIRAVRMANCRIDGTAVETFDLMNRQDIFYQN